MYEGELGLVWFGRITQYKIILLCKPLVQKQHQLSDNLALLPPHVYHSLRCCYYHTLATYVRKDVSKIMAFDWHHWIKEKHNKRKRRYPMAQGIEKTHTTGKGSLNICGNRHLTSVVNRCWIECCWKLKVSTSALQPLL